MNYRIVADSGCDLSKELKEQMDVALVPLTINIDDQVFTDDQNLDAKELLYAMKNSKNHIKTSSPSPADFMKEYEKADNVFVVTLSSKLSGTYNSAMIAKNIILESKEKFIHVFDSLSASIGETLVTMKIFELIQNKCEKLEIVDKVEQYIDGMKTFFILESLDNLIKGGRISRLAGHIASVLSIKPIMCGDKGDIRLYEKVRGSKRAFNRLVEIIGEQGLNPEDRVLGIAYCNALQQAEDLKEKIKERYNFKDIVLVEMAGLTTTYADDGGIVIAF